MRAAMITANLETLRKAIFILGDFDDVRPRICFFVIVVTFLLRFKLVSCLKALSFSRFSCSLSAGFSVFFESREMALRLRLSHSTRRYAQLNCLTV